MSRRSSLLLPFSVLPALLLGTFLNTGCATTRGEGGRPTTELSVVDEKGDGLPGQISVWSRKAQDECEQEGQSCSVDVPNGLYSLNFRKIRAGRLGSGGGAGGGGEKSGGCLRARVQLKAGQKMVCKKRAEFDCDKAAQETLDCGEFAATRYGYKASAGDGFDESGKK